MPAHSARRLFSQLKNTNRRLLFYPKGWHILALDVEHHEVIEDVCDYVDELYNEGLSETGGGKHMRRLIVSIDQGTTGTTVLVLDDALNVLGRANQEFTQHFPKPGWVEHEPEDILESVTNALGNALKQAQATDEEIACIGITNQRETVVVWDRHTGKPVHRAIVWQDRRTAGLCETLKTTDNEALVKKRTGLLLDPYFRAPRSNGFSTKQTLERLLRQETSSVERSTVFSYGTSPADKRM